MKGIKIGKKQIILGVVILVLIAAIAAGNVVLAQNAPMLHKFLGGSSDMGSGSEKEIENTAGLGDAAVQEITADSVVMLKNANGVLPMKGLDKVNLFGWSASDNGFILNGGGSGGVQIHSDNKVTLSKAFVSENIAVNKGLLDKYTAYDDYDADFNDKANCLLVNPGRDFYTQPLIDEAKKFSDTAIIVLGRFAREHYSGGQLEIPLNQPKRNLPTDESRTFLQTSTEEDAMIDVVCANFDKVIVFLNTGNPMELGFIEDERIDAAFYIGYPGQSGAKVIPKILKGEINPSGRVADTYAYDRKTNNPTWANEIYPTESANNIHYAENIYFGYKWYETAAADGFFDDVDNKYGKGYDGVVQFPFGYGQSYTKFTWEVLERPDENTPVFETSKFAFKVRVTNTGGEPGKEVVQLYATPPYTKGGIEKAHVNLLAVAKTERLEPDESQEVTLEFSSYDLASYDDYDRNKNGFTGYELEPGDYGIKLMTDAHKPAECDGALTTLNVQADDAGDGIWMVLDPVSGEIVENRFTGKISGSILESEPYAGIPIDGTTANENVKYMSREDFKATFPEAVTPDQYNNLVISAGSSHSYDGYGYVPVYNQGQNGDLRLVVKEDGSFASDDELSGKVQTALKYNDDLMTKLNDYNSDEWKQLLNQLSHTDIKTITGVGGFQTSHLVSVGKPMREDRDGPTGFHLGAWAQSDNDREIMKKRGFVAFPCAALIGCSFSRK